jgi:hypothetical protein
MLVLLALLALLVFISSGMLLHLYLYRNGAINGSSRYRSYRQTSLSM